MTVCNFDTRLQDDNSAWFSVFLEFLRLPLVLDFKTVYIVNNLEIPFLLLEQRVGLFKALQDVDSVSLHNKGAGTLITHYKIFEFFKFRIPLLDLNLLHVQVSMWANCGIW